MGRIEEALRRRNGDSIAEAPSTLRVRAGEPFESPWSFGELASQLSTGSFARVELEPGTSGPLTSFAGFDEAWLPLLVSSAAADVVLVEQFRQLAATLHQSQAAANTRVVMVTSAEPAEGKSLTALNLALTLAESYGRRVLLIDVDLRRPSLHQIARVPNDRGLGEVLKSSPPQKLPVYQLSERLTLAPAGRPDRDPMTALTSPQMQQLLSEAALGFDWVILDAPPIGPIADSHLLAPLADGVLMVVRASRTRYDSVQKAIESVGRDHVLGVVLNGADLASVTGYRDYYQAQESTAPLR